MQIQDKNASNENHSTIRATSETIRKLKDFREEIRAKTLDEAIKLAVAYAQNYNSQLIVSQIELNDRLNFLEGICKSNSSFIMIYRDELRKLAQVVKELKEMVKEK